MKALKVIAAVLLSGISLPAISQEKPIYDPGINKKDNKPLPLSGKAFDKYVLNKYSFMILGSQAPVSGLKVETSKPSITLSGNFYNNKKKSVIGNIELTGAAQNDFTDIFSQNKLNGLFKTAIGFNFLMPRNNASYLYDKDPHISEAKRQIIRSLTAKLGKAIDTAIMYECLLDKKTFSNPKWYDLLTRYIRKGGKGFPMRYPYHILKAICKQYGIDTYDENPNELLMAFVETWNSDRYPADKKALLLSDKEKYRTVWAKAQDSVYNVEFKTFSNRYSSYTLKWINTSVLTSNTSFKLRVNQADTVLESHNSFLYSAKFATNYYKKYVDPGRFIYFSFAANLGRVNSLDDISAEKFNYKSTREEKVNSTEKLTDEETGTAYKGVFKNGFGVDVSATLYTMPWKKLNILGLYSKLQLSRSDVYINKRRLLFEIGTIWNVNNSGTDNKNLLTIVPFVRWNNLLRQYSNIDKQNVTPLHDLFTVGIQFGVPINIGK